MSINAFSVPENVYKGHFRFFHDQIGGFEIYSQFLRDRGRDNPHSVGGSVTCD